MANPNPSLLAYPEFPEPITAAILNQLFSPRPEALKVLRMLEDAAVPP